MQRNKITLALGLVLVGCGGDDGGSPPPVSPSEPTTPQSEVYSVTAIDGYLQNAQVWLDLNSNFLLDAGEPQARSKEGGVANLDVTDIDNPEQYSVIVQAIAGETVDEDTISDLQPNGVVVNTGYVMSAPAGETDVTPLSTLVHVILTESVDGSETDAELEAKKQQAVSEVASQLGLETEDVLGDFVENEVKEAAFAAQNIVDSEVLPESAEEMQDVIEEVENSAEKSSFLKTTEAVNEKIKEVVESSDDIENEAPVFDTPIGTVDSDLDGVPDDLDAFPNNPNEYLDADDDGLGNNEDTDDDNDGVSDLDEVVRGTDPFNWDTDGDGISDLNDQFPLDASETSDNDSDGVGDNKDTDDDNDGLSDSTEAELNTDPLNPDSDDDGVDDAIDAFPLDPTESVDTDNDGIGNNADTDDDNDEVIDIEDAFPLDPNESVDTDNDGIGNNADTDDDNDGVTDIDDAFPLDPTESMDTDKDGTGNNADTDDDNDGVIDIEDAFPQDPTETVDTDHDGIGNNTDTDDDNDGVEDNEDAFPEDASESVDTDGDGIGDNADTDDDNDGIEDGQDAYPEDDTKSVADVVTSNRAEQIAVVKLNFPEVTVLDVEVQHTIETMNSGEVVTTISKHYTSADGVLFGYEQSIDKQIGEDFTRLIEFAYDFNLDGVASFEGMSLDIGTKTETTEEFWRYVDESGAQDEGGVNGLDRTFDGGAALLSRTHPSDLNEIDMVQKLSVSIDASEGEITKVTDLVEYVVDGFVLADEQTYTPQWANQNTLVERNNIEVFYQDHQDWHADGNVNVLFYLSSNLDGSYVFEKAEPAWANPQDGKFQEYADFNFNDGKWDDLTSYWDYYRKEVQSNGDASELGKRSVLDEERNVMLVVDNDPQNTLFQEWRAESTQISDEKWTKFVQWEHYPLTDYPFTADSLNIGQAYRIYQKQSNGLRIATSFDEWGSQDVDLRLEIENAINGGAALEDIDSELVPGLNRYGKKLPTETFKYDQSGQPVQWYLATDDQRFTEGGDPLMLPVTLENGGLLPGSILGFNDVDVVLVAPTIENPWGWYNAYYREGIETFGFEHEGAAIAWNTSIGRFFLDEGEAQNYLDTVLLRDSDDDGYYDFEDEFPNDPNEWIDSDGDTVGDNGDAFPSDDSEWLDSDGDGYGDNSDAFPQDRNEWLDSDEDGIGDNADEYPYDPNAQNITLNELKARAQLVYDHETSVTYSEIKVTSDEALYLTLQEDETLTLSSGSDPEKLRIQGKLTVK